MLVVWCGVADKDFDAIVGGFISGVVEPPWCGRGFVWSGLQACLLVTQFDTNIMNILYQLVVYQSTPEYRLM